MTRTDGRKGRQNHQQRRTRWTKSYSPHFLLADVHIPVCITACAGTLKTQFGSNVGIWRNDDAVFITFNFSGLPNHPLRPKTICGRLCSINFPRIHELPKHDLSFGKFWHVYDQYISRALNAFETCVSTVSLLPHWYLARCHVWPFRLVSSGYPRELHVVWLYDLLVLKI